MDVAIQTKSLNYSFRSKQKVVNDVSLNVPAGSIYGFLGPNGAGKTTTMRLLTGTLPSECDNVWLMGRSLQKSMPSIFERVGTLIETPSLYLHLTGRENLRVITALRSMKNDGVDHVLKTVGLYESRNRKVKEYSLGMKQRLGIAMALLPDPNLLLLDEPANGLDPTGMIEMRELLKRINREKGITIFISSHLLNEVEKTCSHIGIIHKGRLRFQGSIADLQTSAGAGKDVMFTVSDAESAIRCISEEFPSARKTSANHFVVVFSNETEVARINKLLVECGISVNGIQVSEGLEEWFIKIISQQ